MEGLAQWLDEGRNTQDGGTSETEDTDHPAIRWPLTPALHCSIVRQTSLFSYTQRWKRHAHNARHLLPPVNLLALSDTPPLTPAGEVGWWVGGLQGPKQKITRAKAPKPPALTVPPAVLMHAFD